MLLRSSGRKHTMAKIVGGEDAEAETAIKAALEQYAIQRTNDIWHQYAHDEKQRQEAFQEAQKVLVQLQYIYSTDKCSEYKEFGGYQSAFTEEKFQRLEQKYVTDEALKRLLTELRQIKVRYPSIDVAACGEIQKFLTTTLKEVFQRNESLPAWKAPTTTAAAAVKTPQKRKPQTEETRDAKRAKKMETERRKAERELESQRKAEAKKTAAFDKRVKQHQTKAAKLYAKVAPDFQRDKQERVQELLRIFQEQIIADDELIQQTRVEEAEMQQVLNFVNKQIDVLQKIIFRKAWIQLDSKRIESLLQFIQTHEKMFNGERRRQVIALLNMFVERPYYLDLNKFTRQVVEYLFLEQLSAESALRQLQHNIVTRQKAQAVLQSMSDKLTGDVNLTSEELELFGTAIVTQNLFTNESKQQRVLTILQEYYFWTAI